MAQARAQSLPAPGPYVFAGSGSSYYLAEVVATLALHLGLSARAVPSTDIVLEPEIALRGEGHLIVISRSGTTTEALWALDQAKSHGGWTTTAVTCHRESPLAHAADQTLLSPAGEDETVVMVKSFTSMLMLLQETLYQTGGLPPIGDLGPFAGPVFQAAQDWAKDMAHLPPDRLYVLGSGVRFGIAQEGALKAQEMSNRPASAYAPLEFRHGPWGSVTDRDVIVLLGQSRHRALESILAKDLMARTPRVLVIAQPDWFEERWTSSTILLPREVDDRLLGPLALIPLQYLAWQWTMAIGKDPDHPANITQVVRLDPMDAPGKR